MLKQELDLSQKFTCLMCELNYDGIDDLLNGMTTFTDEFEALQEAASNGDVIDVEDLKHIVLQVAFFVWKNRKWVNKILEYDVPELEEVWEMDKETPDIYPCDFSHEKVQRPIFCP